MTDKNLTEIVAIIDRSGSMSNLRGDTIGGFNSFVNEQKKTDGKAIISLVQFDDKYQIDYEGVDVNDAPLLDESTYIPRGSTALNDALAKTIVTVGERLAKTPEEKRPGQVIFLVITDGFENASKEYKDPMKVREMVTHQTEKYNWTFSYLGGGDLETQRAQGMGLGISAGNVYNYAATSGGTQAVYGCMSKGITRRRQAASRGEVLCSTAPILSEQERDELVAGGTITTTTTGDVSKYKSFNK